MQFSTSAQLFQRQNAMTSRRVVVSSGAIPEQLEFVTRHESIGFLVLCHGRHVKLADPVDPEAGAAPAASGSDEGGMKL